MGTEDDSVITYICGVHFCDYCGDCMVCYSEDECYYGVDGEHCCLDG